MSESAIADFKAHSWDSERGTEVCPTRVVMSTKRIVLVQEDEQTTIPVSSIFDVSREPPLHLDLDAGDVVTIGYHAELTRHTATVVGGSETIDRFSELLFKVVLNGTTVGVAQQAGEPGRPAADGMDAATLTVAPKGMRLGGESPITIPTADLVGVEKEEDEAETVNREGSSVIRLRHRSGDRTVETAISVPSRPKTNVLGRYLRTYWDGHDSSIETITVLFVDDEPGLATVIGEQVAGANSAFETAAATSPAEALEVLKERPEIDCVVSDYKMPTMDGIEFLRAVREARPNIPFILFTGKGSEAVATEALSAGVTDYLTKGMGSAAYDELAERIEKAVVRTRPHTSGDRTEPPAVDHA